VYTLASAIDTTGAIVIMIVIMIVADGIVHITAADRVGLFRAETVHPIEDRVVRVGGIVNRARIVKHEGRQVAAFSLCISIPRA
jgi:hypothetical protein